MTIGLDGKCKDFYFSLMRLSLYIQRRFNFIGFGGCPVHWASELKNSHNCMIAVWLLSY